MLSPWIECHCRLLRAAALVARIQDQSIGWDGGSKVRKHKAKRHRYSVADPRQLVLTRDLCDTRPKSEIENSSCTKPMANGKGEIRVSSPKSGGGVGGHVSQFSYQRPVYRPQHPERKGPPEDGTKTELTQCLLSEVALIFLTAETAPPFREGRLRPCLETLLPICSTICAYAPIAGAGRQAGKQASKHKRRAFANASINFENLLTYHGFLRPVLERRT
ncbi:uncharacterized protein BO97DRAFT_415924 [Aspergillus homomorphus CBS 101889]|uniref:Uncharacterized protein n=1 Tax=Aspergillus homomorphus (strain CBS 101889) TaxID=1450537 RepID=A0A395HUX6_ASPHC|nr:hypothetical protein BO97DRAFT_415924 [Aspergillus homomorphus CBS 101889]RAL10638.1 hypothetical protein BO97DRAFT_415924 [Aspergillus homomorphus CBS 101889]